MFGMPIVVVRLQWGNSRMPVDVEMVRRQAAPRSRPAHRRFRGRLVRCRRPSWAELGVVVADAACASTATLPRIQRRGDFLVMALARTWRVEDGHTLQDLVTYVPTHR
jgi:hypothetical protein